MTAYVDEILVYGNAWGPFLKGSCHLEADTEEELHIVAARIGCKRSWYQPKSCPHYDLTPSMRAKAVAAGVVERPAREAAAQRRFLRHAVFAMAPIVAATLPGKARAELAASWVLWESR